MSTPTPSPRLVSIDRSQLLLCTVDVEQLIDEAHPGRAIWQLAGRLDLSLYHAQIAAVEGGAGREHAARRRAARQRASRLEDAVREV